MTLRTRQALFLTFLLSFLVLAPTIVLFTAGFRYNTQTGQLVKTGALSISTSPRAVTVALNGEATAKTTPHVFKRVIPGTYLIELSRSGFVSWKGRVTVGPGETSFLDQPLLLRNDAPFLEETASFDSSSVSPSGEFIATVKGSVVDVWRTTSGTPSPTPAALSHTPASIVWSANDSYLLALSEDAYSVLTTSGAVLYTDTKTKDESIFFDLETDGTLYIERDDALMTLSLSTLQTVASGKVGAEGYNDIAIGNRTLRFRNLDADTSVSLVGGGNERLIALLPQGDFVPLALKGDRVLLHKDAAELVLLDTSSNEPILLQRPGTLYDWSADGSELVFSDGFELNHYDLKTDTFSLVTRSGSPIKALTLNDDGHYIVVATDQEIAAIESSPVAIERFSAILTNQFSRIDDLELAPDGKSVWISGSTDVPGLFAKRLR